ncbi:hypothetical protein B0E34_20550 [Chryseobacterium mucoviscidosis]|uniref:ISXO2-like transposase domain-containing protein n=1 Tax=Chryseobacterium mucoviscidosis TaxID=1945581 RepID=A0A202BRP6_9FLAO|nr:hypothetical protein B0E34_20550 [Chryseobacterium mucoviscidosis]
MKQDSHVMTDEWTAYKNIGDYFHNHTYVDHGKKQ